MSKKDKFDYDKFKEETLKKLLEDFSLLGSDWAFTSIRDFLSDMYGVEASTAKIQLIFAHF